MLEGDIHVHTICSGIVAALADAGFERVPKRKLGAVVWSLVWYVVHGNR